ncbi:MAG TPA: hypothetical protein VMV17_22365 [Streptosporangiaceae bacterium]|nr:hypothetical protein [Streptosporangiaceae bacterium]
MSLAKNWGLPIRHHSQFSGIGHLNLPAPLSPAMRAVTMRKGALGRLELITQIPGHNSIAAAARALYDGRDSALRQQITKIETAAGFTIIDRSATPLAPTEPGCEFLREALPILQAAHESHGRAPTLIGWPARHALVKVRCAVVDGRQEPSGEGRPVFGDHGS